MMSSQSKFPRYAALAVALALLSCFPLAALGFAGAATVSSQVQMKESAPFGTLRTNTETSTCEDCQFVVKRSVKLDKPPVGPIGTLVNLSSEPAIPSFLHSFAFANSVFSKRFALHHSSLFHQAILIRI